MIIDSISSLPPNSSALVSSRWSRSVGLERKNQGVLSGSGFDKDVFQLIMRMKGGGSRMKVLNALSVAPKDRLRNFQKNLTWTGKQ